ncbi:MAG: J domain-containing protein [Desulfomonilaceae bacterium]|nr:J domain-containing protein [Desulfomonilaceae bacterium]
MNRCTDPYKVLGIDPGATRHEIKRRYRLLSKMYHPDANSGDSNAEETFKLIQWAYETISKGGTRKRYENGASVEQTAPDRFVGPRHPFMSFFVALKSYGSKRGPRTEEGHG